MFLLNGLDDVADELERHQIPFVLRHGRPKQEWQFIAKTVRPTAWYFDFTPLAVRHSQQAFAQSVDFPVYVVDAHNSVPVWVVSPKQEVGARTLRPKLHHHLPFYIGEESELQKHSHVMTHKPSGLELHKLKATLAAQYPSNGTDVARFIPGQRAALQLLESFVSERLKGYASGRNDPLANQQSELSPYLHYGQLASLTVARRVFAAVRADSSLQADADALIEELLVRKELSDNFCYYNGNYRSLQGAPQWAQDSLRKHRDDEREFMYDRQQFENAQTHDEAWNAAQRQLRREGKIHGYMRMYWAKKVLEWSQTPEEALETLIYLNDFYHIDGLDPNGYVGILWSVAGLHDRPWGERPVYGVIRSMVYNGLKRKFDIQAYINQFPA